MRKLILMAMIFGTVGCETKAQANDDDTGDMGTGDPPIGAEVYSDNCAGCHGIDGEGVGTNPSLVERVPQLTDEDLASIIDIGNDLMPSVGLTQDESDAVFLYVRDQFGEEGGS
jgi:mono/diheme cytochrome c family protein